jgi:hypothetical protein
MTEYDFHIEMIFLGIIQMKKLKKHTDKCISYYETNLNESGESSPAFFSLKLSRV